MIEYSLNKSKIVNKPWGKEEWLELNDHYCYKRIYINNGFRTSLQYHVEKHETNYIISGKAKLIIGLDANNLKEYFLSEGDFITIPPGTIHRFVAITDLILQEVSTPHVDDCIRIEDDTQRDNGRIESEHTV